MLPLAYGITSVNTYGVRCKIIDSYPMEDNFWTVLLNLIWQVLDLV